MKSQNTELNAKQAQQQTEQQAKTQPVPQPAPQTTQQAQSQPTPATPAVKRSTWFELAALPVLAGFALGSSFCMGGDGSFRMIKSFSPANMLPKTVGVVGSEGSHSKARNVASRTASTWGLVKTDTTDAWRITEGSKKIVVAVIDTGADVNHPDLRDNLWVNSGEVGRDKDGRDRSSNGIDDDGNGFVDDVHGWNFVFDNERVEDNHGHGTHIAGIIGASGAAKLTGVAPKVSLMILKYFDPLKPQQNPLKATIAAIKYAVANGAQVINYSGGGTSPSAEEFAALQDAERHGILVVAAAGNERSNSDTSRYYPADYGLSNIMSVTAINARSKVLASSNYGVKTVDIAAPGEDIYSTMPGGAYGTMTGTSQATAFATGVAVLLMSHHPDLIGHPRAVIDHLIATGETRGELVGKTKTRAVLNAYRALAMRDSGETVSGVTVSAQEIEDKDQFVLKASK